MKLSIPIHSFFDIYLPQLKGVSDYTLKTYRDTFALFLRFVADYYSKQIDSLTINDLSLKLILSFLDHLETKRNNIPRTRNLRLATLKSFAKMIRLMYPQYKDLAELILNIPQKRAQKNLIGFLTPEELINVYESVNIKIKDGFRDYTILHLLYDSGARASEVATLNLDYFDSNNKTLIILGKGNKYRQVTLWLKTTELLDRYIKEYRTTPKAIYRDRIFINQRGEGFTRFGIYMLCNKYLQKTVSNKKLQYLNPVHSFRHSCAVHRLYNGESLTDIKNRLGHEDLQTTMIYLKYPLQKVW